MFAVGSQRIPKFKEATLRDVVFFAIFEIKQVHFVVEILVGAIVDQPLVIFGKVDGAKPTFRIMNQLGEFSVSSVHKEDLFVGRESDLFGVV